jgi:hypothetical protein
MFSFEKALFIRETLDIRLKTKLIFKFKILNKFYQKKEKTQKHLNYYLII